MQVDYFIGDGGYSLDGKRDQGGVTPLSLELGQVGGCHLTTFAGDLEQPVLVHRALDTRRQVKCLPCLEAFDVFEHVPRIWLDG